MNTLRDWQEDLSQFLISSGTNGRKQTEIVKQFGNRVRAAELENLLDSWRSEGKVQKFILPPPGRGGRPPVQWRATVKLLEGL